MPVISFSYMLLWPNNDPHDISILTKRISRRVQGGIITRTSNQINYSCVIKVASSCHPYNTNTSYNFISYEAYQLILFFQQLQSQNDNYPIGIVQVYGLVFSPRHFQSKYMDWIVMEKMTEDMAQKFGSTIEKDKNQYNVDIAIFANCLTQRFQYLIYCVQALKTLHQLGFSHRDVTPFNFLVTDQQVKLCDFESLWHSSWNPTQYLVSRTQKRDNFQYLSPERIIILKSNNLTIEQNPQASDVYSLALVFIDIYWSLPLKNSLERKQKPHILPFSSTQMKTNAIGLQNILFKCLNLNSINRPSCDQLLQKLQHIQQNIDFTQEAVSRFGTCTCCCL